MEADKFTADVCCYGCYHAWFYPWRKDDNVVKIENDPDISMVELSHSLAGRPKYFLVHIKDGQSVMAWV